jgi:hypothetical protein
MEGKTGMNWLFNPLFSSNFSSEKGEYLGYLRAEASRMSFLNLRVVFQKR